MNFKDVLRLRLFAKPDYEKIRKDYESVIYAIILAFMLDEKKNKQDSQNEMEAAMLAAFILAYNTGVKDGGSSRSDKKWIKNRIEEEIVFITLLFIELEMYRQSGEVFANTHALAKSIGYTKTLDGIYNQGKVTGAGDLLLTFLGQDGKPPFPCKTCDYWYGKMRPASFWVENDLIPHPGSETLECGGWQCHHYLEDQLGNKFTY